MKTDGAKRRYIQHTWEMVLPITVVNGDSSVFINTFPRRRSSSLAIQVRGKSKKHNKNMWLQRWGKGHTLDLFSEASVVVLLMCDETVKFRIVTCTCNNSILRAYATSWNMQLQTNCSDLAASTPLKHRGSHDHFRCIWSCGSVLWTFSMQLLFINQCTHQ